MSEASKQKTATPDTKTNWQSGCYRQEKTVINGIGEGRAKDAVWARANFSILLFKVEAGADQRAFKVAARSLAGEKTIRK